MNWAWAASLDQIWRSPNLPLYLTLATAGFVGIIVLITLLRVERSAANGVLALITLLAIGVAGAVTFRGFGAANTVQSTEARPVQTASAALPQLSCIDDLAGDAVLSACEKTLFGSAESVAAAVSYAASQITLLTSLGDVATANKGAGSDTLALRRALEQDRYGLVAYVLTTRDRCTPTACRAFRSLTDSRQIVANMNERAYESLIMRYAASWNAPPQAASGLVAALPPSVPTGKPTNAEFPTSASTPPVSIMTPEPPSGAKPPAAATAPAAPRPAAATPPASTTPPPALAAAKKPPPAQKRPSGAAPVQLAPSASAPAPSDNE
ncbi:hypothetical protein GWE18_12665 [Bradyrhizobium sp. CSA112]|uniref:hypothetical protein n=1 Tax=Bradyrhizobium sp. CSA112 TaxID=2699170 RepID=UPI0023B0D212|nr:hypothetical protein [Bradyrhizobium sp. CSA112]MDE5453700.1 hypothetical protein [Bradyrhizobium sp. CSA112]